MRHKVRIKPNNLILILGIIVTLTVSGVCWSKVLYSQKSELNVAGLPSVESTKRTGKKVVFLGGVFLGITKYLRSDK